MDEGRGYVRISVGLVKANDISITWACEKRMCSQVGLNTKYLQLDLDGASL